MTVSQTPTSLTAPIDCQFGGVLLANMLVAWFEGELASPLTEESADEHQDHRIAPP